MKEIYLTKGLAAVVDDEDYERVSAFKWSAMISKRKTMADVAYAYRRTNWDNANRVWRGHIYLHRFILNEPFGLEVDHKDGNPLNCVRQNLRTATHSQNMVNRRLNPGSLGFRGTTMSKGYIIAQINGRMIGAFKTAEDAARAYDAAAEKEYGEFAMLNFPHERTTGGSDSQ